MVEEGVPWLLQVPSCSSPPAEWPGFLPGVEPVRQEIVRQTQAKQASGKTGQRCRAQ